MVSSEVLNAFAKKLDSDTFRKRPRNVETHGMFHIFNPVADHVVPYKQGGRTNLDNLVTSCAACNYGKDRYTLEQLGLSNPLLRQPVVDGWDGLVAHLNALRGADGSSARMRP